MNGLLVIAAVSPFAVVFLLGLCGAASRETPSSDFAMWEEELHG
jgi:hypothetical protein